MILIVGRTLGIDYLYFRSLIAIISIYIFRGYIYIM